MAKVQLKEPAPVVELNKMEQHEKNRILYSDLEGRYVSTYTNAALSKNSLSAPRIHGSPLLTAGPCTNRLWQVFQLFRCSYFIEFTFLLMPNLASRALVVV
jgi:hypothetical protein